MAIFLQQLINGIAQGGMYALIALGYTMVYGIVELINFAHGDVFTLGSFLCIAILALLGVSASGQIIAGWQGALIALLVVVLAALLCGVIGVLIERFAYRRLRNAPRLAPLITAIGVSFLLQGVMRNWKGPSEISFPQFLPNPTFAFGGVHIDLRELLVVIVSILMMVALQFFIYNTKLGKAMRASAQDRDAASLMGINVNTTIAWTFFIGSALAGVAGFISGMYFGTTMFTNGYQAGLKAFTAAVLGGIGNIAGAMLGGFLIGIVEAMTAQYISDQWTNVVVFSILVLILVLRPSGLLGEQLPEKV
ncbi:MAG: branched-chain amino acid ABC transporter permease [Candidatus Eremiobacteraeota bacterium]|nr:branched-chain amino acid ABC transporter permease [Candidatus Eremiobacteraeota bacterium]MBV8366553.1 branched-chain amino acid ABC transporter permease [Candidatus Eremiobacteraeota bacterium]